MELEDDEDPRGIGAKLLRRADGNDFLRSAKPKLLIITLRHRDAAKDASRRRVEIIGRQILFTILKVGNR